MINKVTLIGNTGRDSEVRVLENGTQVCSFSVATTESYKDKNDQWQDQTEWHNVVVWRPSQNVASLPKGAKVYVEGKISIPKV
jgi:single-strand DNA-binding protein